MPFPSSEHPASETSAADTLDRLEALIRQREGDLTLEDWEGYVRARNSLTGMGFVFPRPGEAFGVLGGQVPSDPLEQRVRRELGLD